MSWTKRISLASKSLRDLGMRQVGWYALYQLQLRSGYLGWHTRDDKRQAELPEMCFRLSPLLTLPNRQNLLDLLGEAACREAMNQADDIIAGRVRLFGGEPVPLELGETEQKPHWSAFEKSRVTPEEADIKWIWEPGRFGWAIALGRAYWLGADERYPTSFWHYTEAFQQANPPYQGVHWLSSQEVSIRLIALVFCAQIFAGSPHSTPERMAALGRMVAAHARRISPGMAYARAQNNNHLLSEAAGLSTAGWALLAHPESARWRKVGWNNFHQGLREQIYADGSYVQHSTNYHRLMLQLACWMAAAAASRGETFPEASLRRLQDAVCWLLDLLDRESGDVPNLGPNDGAYILPLAGGSFRDYRPVIQAASRIFLGKPALRQGIWDEMALWLGGRVSEKPSGDCAMEKQSSTVKLEQSWAYLRGVRFISRPGHADQLHVDLWWHGINLALDPGSYLYNASPPWDNILKHTRFHNSVTVNGLDQMTPAGRFLWLDWAQAGPVLRETHPGEARVRLSAGHNGYRRLSVMHRRTLTGYRELGEERWQVEDTLEAVPKSTQPEGRVYSFRLHWLVPDYPWELSALGDELALNTPHGLAKLTIHMPGVAGQNQLRFSLVRAGESLFGEEAEDPARGWHAPGYGYKYPALSLSATVESTLPLVLVSEWLLAAKER